MHCRTDQKVESSEACRRMCQLYPNCVAWTWIEPTFTLYIPFRKNCVPKHAIGNKINRAGVISGGRECISRGMEFFHLSLLHLFMKTKLGEAYPTNKGNHFWEILSKTSPSSERMKNI